MSYFCSIPLNDYKLLVCDIQQLLVAVTIHSCSSSGSQYFRIIEDLITLLGFMQTSKMHRTQGEDWICKIHSKHIGVAVSCAPQFIRLISSCPILLHKETVVSLSSLTAEWKQLEGGEEMFLSIFHLILNNECQLFEITSHSFVSDFIVNCFVDFAKFRMFSDKLKHRFSALHILFP